MAVNSRFGNGQLNWGEPAPGFFPPAEQGSAPRKARPTLARQLSVWVEESVVGKPNKPKVGFYEIRVLPTFV